MIQIRWLFLVLLVTGCASNAGPSPQDVQAQRASGSFQPAPGTAGLYIFKKGIIVGATDSFQINLDGQMVGLVAAGSYLYESLSPGVHTITSGTSQLSLNVQPGRNYFVQQTPNFGTDGSIVSSTLSIAPPDVGLAQVRQMQAANFSH